MKNADEHFKDWEGSVFGYGYGSGEEHVIPALKRFMALVPPESADGRAYDYKVLEADLGPAVAWFLINALCHADLIEYGSSPRFGWLTPHGYALKGYIDGKTDAELLAALDFDDERIPCYPDYCNCDEKPCGNPFWGPAAKANQVNGVGDSRT